MVSPESDGISEVDRKLMFINSFIDEQLASRQPYLDDDWSGDVVTSECDGHLQTSRNTLLSFRSTDIESGSEEAIQAGGYKAYKRIHINSNGISSSLDIYEEGTFDFSWSQSKKTEEFENQTLEEAVNLDLFHKVLDQICAAIDEAKADKEVVFASFELPDEIEVSELDHATDEEIEPVIVHETDVYAPAYEMSTKNGDKWLSSLVFSSPFRHYAVLYRQNPRDGKLTPYPVYTSGSQGTWRLLPRILLDYKGPGTFFYDKGLGGEEVLNLPINLQQTLWQLQQDQLNSFGSSFDFTDHEINNTLHDVTEATYHVNLAGMGSNPIRIHDYINDAINSNLVPLSSSTPDPLFEFISPEYGKVQASVVDSRDETVRYLIYTQESSGKSWLGMAEPKDSRMLESFILDSYVQDDFVVNIYAPLREYRSNIPGPINSDSSEKDGYVDNDDQVEASLVLKALSRS